MADPARKPDEENKSNITPDIPGLRALEGGRDTSEPKTGHLSLLDNKDGGSKGDSLFNRSGDKESTGESKDDLGTTGASSATGIADGLYSKAKGLSKSDIRAKSGLKFFAKHKKGSGLAGLAIGLLVALGVISSGPLQLVHLSQILQKTFSHSDHDTKLRTRGLFRYARSGNFGETRVTKLGSVVFSKTIEQLKAVGIEFQTNSVDQIKSATFDTEKLSKSYPELKGMSSVEARSFLANEFGLSESMLSGVGSGSDVGGHKFAANTRDFGVKATRALKDKSLSTLDDGKIVGAIKRRVLSNYFELPNLFHPLKRAAANANKKVVTAAERKAEEQKRSQALNEPVETTPEVIKAKSNLKDKLGGLDIKAGIGKALLFTAGMCLIRSVADDVVTVNRAAIVLPSAVQATDKIAVGSQTQSNKDISVDKAGSVVQGFKDENGKNIWQGKALQALAGTNPSGEDLGRDYKQAYSNNTTASNIKDKLGGGGFGDAACSPLGQAVQLIAGVALAISNFADGGLSFGAKASIEVAQTAATAGAFTLLEHQFVNLLKDKAIVPAVLSGPLGGNLLAYGARETANITARSSGGVELSAAESVAFDQAQAGQDLHDFQRKNFFARTFDTHDYRSVASRVGDNMSPNISDNIASVANSFNNMGSLMSAIFLPFTSRAHAATNQTYDWGFPEYGLPKKMLNDSKFIDPYANADIVAPLLDNEDSGSGTDYKGRSMACFGVEVSKTADGWDAVPKEMINPNSESYTSAKCDDLSDGNWERVMLFVFDTETMKSIDCSQKTDTSDQSCKDLGIGNSSSTAATVTDTATVTGSAADLAQQLLDSKNVTPGTNPLSSLKAAAAGNKSPSGIDKCGVQHPPVFIDVKLLSFLVDLSKVDAYTINSLTTGAHACDSNHYKGLAVDFGCDVDITKADSIGKKYGISHNTESCADPSPHFHYSVGGN